jgi:two-component system, NarL family, sensor histidine kinase UhpB
MRTEFAREVNDELWQALTALKMDMFWISKRLPREEKALIAEADASLALVDSTLRSVRRICTELRPDILDHLGITAAVEWQIEEFRKRQGSGVTEKIRAT